MTAKNPRNHQKEKNPIQLRREAAGLTQRDLTAVAAVSVHTVQRTEQGLMPSLPTRIFIVLYNEHNYEDNKLDKAVYNRVNDEINEWKSLTRRLNVEYLRDNVGHLHEWFSWIEFRERIAAGKTEFCKLFCIHPQALDNFEKPWLRHKRDRLSGYLEEIMEDAGLSEEEIDKINAKLRWYIEAEGLSS